MIRCLLLETEVGAIFKKADISAIEKLKKSNFIEHIQVTFIATKSNISELPEVYRLLSMLEIDSLRISGVDPIGRAKDNEEFLLSMNS